MTFTFHIPGRLSRTATTLMLATATAGTTVLVDRTLWLYDIGRRDVRTDRLSWARLIAGDIGEPLVVALQNGRTLRLPEVTGITVLE
jgi:hypothetical protein